MKDISVIMKPQSRMVLIRRGSPPLNVDEDVFYLSIPAEIVDSTPTGDAVRNPKIMARSCAMDVMFLVVKDGEAKRFPILNVRAVSGVLFAMIPRDHVRKFEEAGEMPVELSFENVHGGLKVTKAMATHFHSSIQDVFKNWLGMDYKVD